MNHSLLSNYYTVLSMSRYSKRPTKSLLEQLLIDPNDNSEKRSWRTRSQRVSDITSKSLLKNSSLGKSKERRSISPHGRSDTRFGSSKLSPNVMTLKSGKRKRHESESSAECV